MIDIYFLVPTTSKNRKHKNYFECDFIQILFSSLIKLKHHDYNYTFLLGYDEDDVFFENNIQQITDYVNKKGASCIGIKLSRQKKTLVQKWNYLFERAILIENSFYFFQVGDDIKFLTKN